MRRRGEDDYNEEGCARGKMVRTMMMKMKGMRRLRRDA